MLSAIVTTHNSENTITRCLKSLSFAGETIVVDSGSTDRTLQLAHLQATIIRQPWLGYGPQKNAGAKHARGDWLLFVDADEVVTPALAEEIIKTTTYQLPTTHSIYWLRIITVFLGKPLPHLYGHNPRLFRKNAARWTAAEVHEQIIRSSPALRKTASGQRPPVKLGDPDTGLLTTPLIHNSHATIRSYLHKMHQYTTLDARQMARTGRHRSGRPVAPTPWLPHHLAAKQFIKLLLYRRGLLDGYAGMTWCLLSAYYEWEMGRKYLKMTKPQ